MNWAWAAKPDFTAENPEPEYTEREKKQVAQHDRWYPFGTGEGRGYIAIQSTRPATINFALRDSPIGLLAWIWDKLVSCSASARAETPSKRLTLTSQVDWTDNYPWTEDEVCLWVSLYVFSTAGPDAASYIYYEALHDTEEITIPVVQAYINVYVVCNQSVVLELTVM